MDVVPLLWIFFFSIIMIFFIGCCIYIFMLRKIALKYTNEYADFAKNVVVGLTAGTAFYIATKIEEINKSDFMVAFIGVLQIFFILLFVMVIGALMYIMIMKSLEKIEKKDLISKKHLLH